MEARVKNSLSGLKQMKNEPIEEIEHEFGVHADEADLIGKDISAVLKTLREQKGLRQQDVADMSLVANGGDERKALSQRNVAYIEAKSGYGPKAAQYAAVIGVKYSYVVAMAEARVEATQKIERQFK